MNLGPRDIKAYGAEKYDLYWQAPNLDLSLMVLSFFYSSEKVS